MSIEAMKQALEALELVLETDTKPKHEISKSITFLRQALEQAEKQEPVAWMYEVNGAHTILDLFEPPDDAYDKGTLYPLYTTPQPQQQPVNLVAYNCKCGRTMKFESVNGVVAPQREWVGLTDEEVQTCWDNAVNAIAPHYSIARTIEAKLKERNHVS